MSIKAIQELVHDDLKALDVSIHNQLVSDIPFVNQLCHYIIDSGGKRMRPLLLILCANACNYRGDQHITLATAIEFFHTATLLHDDVVDASSIRRGKQTAHDIWGSKASILVGDYLYTRAVQMVSGIKNIPIMTSFSNASNTMSKGEILQLLNCKVSNISEQDYMEVIKCKTAVLFATSAEIGSLLSGADNSLCSALYQYGIHLGNAFQIADDMLDYCSEKNKIGKNIGDDLSEGKITLPLIKALQKATPAQAQIIHDAIQNARVEKLHDLLETIHSTGAMSATSQIALRESELAISKFNQLAPSPFKEALSFIAKFAVERQF